MSYVKRVMRETGGFTVENMVEYAKQELDKPENTDMTKDLHRFTIELLEFEIGLDIGSRELLGGKKNFINMVSKGSQITAYAASGMRSIAIRKLKELGYIRIHKLKICCQNHIKAHHKYTMEGFYYRSALRYLRCTGQR